jgi:hypothetical protein
MDVSPFDGCGGRIGVVIRVSSSVSSKGRYTRRGHLPASPCCWSKLAGGEPVQKSRYLQSTETIRTSNA